MGTLTRFDADNGTDGVTCTTVNLPALTVTIGGSGALTFSASANLTSGSLGYRFQPVSAQRCYFRIPLTPSKIQAFRGTLKLVSPTPSTDRPLLRWDGSGQSIYLYWRAAGRLRIADTTGASVVDGPTVVQGGEYDVSLLLSRGASANENFVSLKLYQKASSVQVGVTASGSGFTTLGGSNFPDLDIGSNDQAAADIEYYWDTIRVEDGRTTEFPPHTAIVNYDAENGVDGVNVTTGDFTAVGGSAANVLTINSPSFFKYDASAAPYGRQSYHVFGDTTLRSFVGALLPWRSRQISTRMGVRLLQAASSDRPLGYWGSGAAGSVFAAYIRSSRRVRFFNGAGLGVDSNVALTFGQDYEVAVTATVGASTNDGIVTGRIYDKASGALLDTWSSSTANLQAASTGFDRFQVGVIENTSTPIEYLLDNLRYADRADPLGALPASMTRSVALTLAPSAVIVPKVASPKLRLG